MKVASEQQIFNKVYVHLLRRGKRATVKKLDTLGRGFIEICQYRTKDGNTCAVGCLIDEEHYSPELEGALIGCSELMEALTKSNAEIKGHSMHRHLEALQKIHDTVEVEDWREALDDYAKTLGLTTPNYEQK